MATMSAAERRRYREPQKLRQGYVTGPPVSPVGIADPPARPGGSSAQGSPQPRMQLSAEVVVADHPSNVPRPPPFRSPPPTKKLRVGPRYEFGLPLQGEPTTNAGWKDVLGSQEGVDGRPDSLVRSIFDARCPLNEVLSKAVGAGDVERVQSLGVVETMTAVKSYGHYVSILTHLVGDSFKKTVAEHSRLEKELKKVEVELEKYKLERTQLKEELKKYVVAKEWLDREVKALKQDKKRLSDALGQAKKD